MVEESLKRKSHDERESEKEVEVLLDKLEVIGQGSWFLWKIFLLCMIPSILNGLNLTSYVYLAEVPEHWCKIPSLDQLWSQDEIRMVSSVNGINGSSCTKYDWDYEMFVNMTFEEALIYITSHEKPNTSPCDQFQYAENVSSMVKTYNLVCERTPLKSSVQVALSLGKFVGAFLFGVIADKYGRRSSFLLGSLVYIVSGPFVAFAYNYIMMIVGRIGLGAAGSGIYQSAYVILTEIASKKKRAVLSILYNMSYPIGQMIIPLIAYYIRDWRILQVVISAPSVLILFFYWFLPESPRWLISKGRRQEATTLIQKEYSKINNRVLNENLESYYAEHSDEVEVIMAPKPDSENKRQENADSNSARSQNCDLMVNQSKQSNFYRKIIFTLRQLIQLVRYSELRHRLFIILFCWCICSLSYYALALNVDNFHTDRYVYGFLTGLVEVPSYILPLPFLKCLGRRHTSVLLFYTGGLALLSILAIPQVGTDSNLFLLIVSSIGRLCVSSVFAVVILHTSELFPTPVRNTAIGCGSTSSHIGSMSAPLVVDLLGAYAWFIPSTLCGVATILAGTVIFLLPETRNKALPETIGQVSEAPKEERTGFHQICR